MEVTVSLNKECNKDLVMMVLFYVPSTVTVYFDGSVLVDGVP